MNMKSKKGQMARRLVYFCVGVMAFTALWAMVVKTVAIFYGFTTDLSDVLLFVGGGFGTELLMCLVKRVFAKPTDDDTKG